jgi:transcriptional activator SPT8
MVRNFAAHGAQLSGVAVRPIAPPSTAANKNSTKTSESTQAAQPMQIDTPHAPESATMDVDAKSDTSYDPLFDDDPDSTAAADGNDKKGSTTDLQLPSSDSKPALVSLAMPGQGQQQPQTGRAAAIPPKNAPPLLDHNTYSTFSSDILMTSAIDGQVILWDRRVNTPGKGVGRLWMSDKTPPWCLSVCLSFHPFCYTVISAFFLLISSISLSLP